MSNRNTVPMDWTRDKMSILLRKLQSGLPDREGARELKPLPEEERRNAERVGFNPYVDQLKVLIV